MRPDVEFVGRSLVNYLGGPGKAFVSDGSDPPDICLTVGTTSIGVEVTQLSQFTFEPDGTLGNRATQDFFGLRLLDGLNRQIGPSLPDDVSLLVGLWVPVSNAARFRKSVSEWVKSVASSPKKGFKEERQIDGSKATNSVIPERPSGKKIVGFVCNKISSLYKRVTMPRLAPKMETLRALFARSGNQCAFPGCTHPLINDDNLFIGQVCHIEAASSGGERFNPDSDDEYRRSYGNLILLCYPHHIETNDTDRYPVEKLRLMKLDHEQLFEKSSFKIDEAALHKLKDQMDEYWEKIERANKLEHVFLDSGLAMEVNGQASFFEVMQSAHSAIDGIENMLEAFRESDESLLQDLRELLGKSGLDISAIDTIPYYENPFFNRNWEYHNLGSANWLQRIRIDLVHIEVKYLEEYLITNNADLKAKSRLDELKSVLEEYARNAIHVD